jgi:hypothetical protein
MKNYFGFLLLMQMFLFCNYLSAKNSVKFSTGLNEKGSSPSTVDNYKSMFSQIEQDMKSIDEQKDFLKKQIRTVDDQLHSARKNVVEAKNQSFKILSDSDHKAAGEKKSSIEKILQEAKEMRDDIQNSLMGEFNDKASQIKVLAAKIQGDIKLLANKAPKTVSENFLGKKNSKGLAEPVAPIKTAISKPEAKALKSSVPASAAGVGSDAKNEFIPTQKGKIKNAAVYAFSKFVDVAIISFNYIKRAIVKFYDHFLSGNVGKFVSDVGSKTGSASKNLAPAKKLASPPKVIAPTPPVAPLPPKVSATPPAAPAPPKASAIPPATPAPPKASSTPPAAPAPPKASAIPPAAPAPPKVSVIPPAAPAPPKASATPPAAPAPSAVIPKAT